MSLETGSVETAPVGKHKGLLRAFWDFLILFSGISTASNLSRTQPRPVRRKGLFLFRKSGTTRD